MKKRKTDTLVAVAPGSVFRLKTNASGHLQRFIRCYAIVLLLSFHCSLPPFLFLPTFPPLPSFTLSQRSSPFLQNQSLIFYV